MRQQTVTDACKHHKTWNWLKGKGPLRVCVCVSIKVIVVHENCNYKTETTFYIDKTNKKRTQLLQNCPLFSSLYHIYLKLYIDIVHSKTGFKFLHVSLSLCLSLFLSRSFSLSHKVSYIVLRVEYFSTGIQATDLL